MSTIYYNKTFQRCFGTFPLNHDQLLQAIDDALDVGYRAFDTAQMYQNEAAVGEALANSSYDRDDLCIVTKVHPDNYSPDKFIKSVEESLKKLRVDTVDVLLLHWPIKGQDIAPQLRLLEEAYKSQYTKHIGVSNYNVKMMQDAVKIIDAPIITNQVEFHPLLDQSQLLATADAVNIPLSSYCSVARGEVLKYPIFDELGRAYNKTAIQICLRWILQKGVSLNTMSTKKHNMQANFDIMDFSLSHVDMARIDPLCKTNFRVVPEEMF